MIEGRPVDVLDYWSPRLNDYVNVDWGESGSHNFTYDAGNIIPLKYHVGLLAHEWGHELWSGDGLISTTHLGFISTNDVPINGPTVSEPAGYGYNLMGGGACCPPAVPFINISVHERLLRGWISPVDLIADAQDLLLQDLYTSGSAFSTSLVGNRTLYVSNLQRKSYLSRLEKDPSRPYPFNEVYAGLPSTGMLIAISNGNDLLDTVPQDNTLTKQAWYSFEPNPYDGDLYGPGTSTQITPWTRPNINGCASYNDSFCDTPQERTWKAIDDIRYLPNDPDSTLVFDFYTDYRTAPLVAIRADSWMGAETDSTTFTTPVRVYDGATLTIEAGTTLAFTQDLVVEAGAALVVEDGAVLRFASGKRLDVYGTLTADGATFTKQTTGNGWRGLFFRPGSGGTVTDATVSEVRGGLGTAAVRTLDASPVFTGTTITVPAGSQALGVYSSGSSSGSGARLTYSTVTSGSNPAVYAGENGYVSVYESSITQTSSEAAVMAEGLQAVVAFSPPPGTAPVDTPGENRITGGRLLARGSGLIQAGLAPSTMSENHFCDETAAELEASALGTIYARYDYWPTSGGPTITLGSGTPGTVYYSDNLGLPDCGTGRVVASALGGRPVGGAPESGEGGSGASDLFAALALKAAGDFEGALALLAGVVAEGGEAAPTALDELARLHAVAPTLAVGAVLGGAAGSDGPHRTNAQRALADVYAREGSTAAALALLDAVATVAAGTSEGFFAEFARFQVHLASGDTTAALAALALAEPVTAADAWTLALEEASLSEGTEGGFAAAPPASAGADLPAAYALEAAYPNPFTGQTTLPFALPEAAEVTVEVYDLLGRRVAVLADGPYEAGRHAVVLDGRGLASGVYVVRAVMRSSAGTGETVRAFTRRVTVLQ